MKGLKANIPRPVIYMAASILLLAMALGWTTYTNLLNSRHLMYSYLENEGVKIALKIEERARSSVINNRTDLDPILEEFTKLPFIAHLSVVDRDLEILAGQQLLEEGSQKLAEKVFRQQKMASRLTHSLEGAVVYEVGLPLHLGGYEGEGIPATGGNKPKYKTILMGIYTSYGFDYIRSAIVHSILVAVLLGALGLLTLYQLRTLKEYFELLNRSKEQEKLVAVGMLAAGVAHEIRNPLGSVKGLAQLMAEEDVAFVDSREYLRTIVQESIRMEQFVNQLLDYAKPQEFRLERIKIANLLTEIELLILPQARQYEAAIEFCEVKGDDILVGDPRQLKQIFLNLLLNGLQVSGRGAKIQIQCQIKEGLIKVDVLDNGPGIPLGDEEKIFEPLFTTKPKGLGLGLAICKRIVENHGGRIWANNRSKGGAIFSVILPREGRDGYGS